MRSLCCEMLKTHRESLKDEMKSETSRSKEAILKGGPPAPPAPDDITWIRDELPRRVLPKFLTLKIKCSMKWLL